MLLELDILGVSIGPYVVATGVAAGVFVAMRLVLGIVRVRIRAARLSRAARAQALLVDVASSISMLLLLPVAIYAGTRFLSLSPGQETALGVVVAGSLLIQAGIVANHLLGFWAMTFRDRDETDAAPIGVMVLMGRIALWSVLTLVILDTAGIDVTTVVAGLGIGGIAVALALQNILGDLFSSLSIQLDRPFAVGDFIVVDDALGTVEHVGLKTTRIRSLSGEQLVFSNADILQSRIRNYRRMDERRVLFTIGVTYSTARPALEAIPGVLREIVEADDRTRFDRAHFARFADSALEFEVVYFVLSPDFNLYMDVQERINYEIVRRFDAAGIDFAFPSRTVYMEQVGDDRS